MSETNLDSSALSRKHSPKDLAVVEKDVVNLLVKLAHANGWNVMESLQEMHAKVEHATDDHALIEAYKDRLEVLINGLK